MGFVENRLFGLFTRVFVSIFTLAMLLVLFARSPFVESLLVSAIEEFLDQQLNAKTVVGDAIFP